MAPYGDGIITFKKETMSDRTTITVGDSLRNALDGRYIMGSKITDIDSTVCIGRPNTINDLNDSIIRNINQYGVDDASSVGGMTCGYFELQFHGDVTLKDIDSITIDKYLLDEIKQDPYISNIAKEFGINFKYMEFNEVKDYKF